MALVALIEAVVFAAVACSALLSQYFTITGFSPLQVGVLMALTPVTGLYGNLIYFQLAARLTPRKLVRIFSTIAMSMYWILFLVDGFVWKLLAMACFSFFFGAILPITEYSVVEIAQREMFPYSALRVWGTIGYALSALISSRLVSLNFSWVFVLMTIFLISLYPLADQLDVRIPKIKRTTSSKLPRSFFAFCVIMGLTVGFNYFNVVFLPTLSDKKGYEVSTVSLALSFMAVSELPFLLNAEKLRKVLTSRLLFASGVFVVGLRLILVSLSWSVTSLLAFQLLHGWTYIVLYYSSIYIIREGLSSEQLPSAQGFFWMTLMGFGPLFGSLVGGLVVQAIGVQMTYSAFGILCILLFILIQIKQLA